MVFYRGHKKGPKTDYRETLSGKEKKEGRKGPKEVIHTQEQR